MQKVHAGGVGVMNLSTSVVCPTNVISRVIDSIDRFLSGCYTLGACKANGKR